MKLFSKKNQQVQEASVKQQTRLIVFAGSENGLFPFLTAVKLKNNENDVLLVDNSQTHDIFSAVPKQGEIGNANEVSVVADRMITPEVFEKFDYVIAYLGYNYEESYYQQADLFVLLCDYTLVARQFMHDFDPQGTPVRLVFFNRISNRVSEKSLVDVMQHCTMASLGEFISLEFTEVDGAAYIGFLYEGYRSLSSMSREYQKAISIISNDAIKGFQAQTEDEDATEEDKK